MKISIKDIAGQSQGELEVKFAMIENGKGTQAVHDVVTAYRAAQRSGTACTKNVGEVTGTNKKPWRQKGTGRARAGSFQSPLWVGGGVVFGPKPRDFSKTTTRKTRSLALRKALSERIKAGDVILLDDLKLATHKTKEFVKVVKALDLQGTVLFIADPDDQYLDLAARNVEKVTVTNSDTLNTYDVLRPDKLVFTRSAFEKVEARLTKE
jgi:large subunit ribosomal protein L4